eukprot:TRINITY_DN30022_c0_g1_i1.p1 TRINITY_DN30022_c0_g1~~TRINITY_DN30022_c0_g1_i1.p1  ORF type:complete len:355 (+),score=81.55 TRINITY_DN30022_c0_g1_i1:101-1165(+)
MPRRSPGEDGPPLKQRDLAAALRNIDEQLETARANAEALASRAGEWEDVKAVLEDLPKKVRHPIMVPMGPLAFFEGHLKHTGEVLAQLSSEWFALRTVDNALGMIKRREGALRKDRDAAALAVRELEQRRAVAVGARGEGAPASNRATSASAAVPEAVPGGSVSVDDDGFFDIREPYVEESSLPATLPPSEPSSCAGAREQSTLSRLRELERMEEEEELAELDELVEGYERDGSAPACGTSAPESVAPPTNASPVRGPADLYRLMQEAEDVASGGYPPAESSRIPEVANAPPAAQGGFTGVVRERAGAAAPDMPTGCASGRGPPRVAFAGVGDHAAEEEAPKRISKFKASRQGR